MTDSAPPPAPPPPPPAPTVACVLCGAPRADAQSRCAACGLHPGLGPTEANPFDARAIRLLVGGFVAVYVVALAVTAAVS